MNALRVWVEGIGLWSPHLGDFAALRQVLAGERPAPPPKRPAATTLSPNERRRAPDSVLLAVEVAGQAVAMSKRDASILPCVFSSSHGDQPITDYMCATLAQAPAELSPIRFHNSVHNAPVGYWTIATGCLAPSIAVAAQRASFGAGLLEAASQVLTGQRPVLLVCSDTAGSGPLGEVTHCSESFAVALVLAPAAGSSSVATLDLRLLAGHADNPLPEPLVEWRRGNPSATSLALLALLNQGSGRCHLAASTGLDLQVDVACTDKELAE
ncbi:MAG TPA: beta-ketoacyl synthase chain length factor [Rhodanobacter sp.]|nr:beta-ketoacyl synthase chain length factor [Rhodanobacter sp.]